MHLKKYITSASVVLMMGSAYSSRFFSRLFLNLTLLAGSFFLWSTLYQNKEIVRGYTLTTMFTYYAVTFVISKFTSSATIAGNIGRGVRSGRFSFLLLRPMNPSAYISIQHITARFVDFVIPIIVFTTFLFVFPDIFTKPANLPLFLLSFILGLLINLLTFLVIGVTAFWTINNSGLVAMFTRFGDVMSGAILPLTFFPIWLTNISMFLPFRYAHFVPVSIYLGTIDINFVYQEILGQTAWVILLLFSYKFLFSKGLKNYDSVGN